MLMIMIINIAAAGADDREYGYIENVEPPLHHHRHQCRTSSPVFIINVDPPPSILIPHEHYYYHSPRFTAMEAARRDVGRDPPPREPWYKEYTNVVV